MSVDTYLPYCRYLAQDRSYQASVSPGNIRSTDTLAGPCFKLASSSYKLQPTTAWKDSATFLIVTALQRNYLFPRCTADGPHLHIHEGADPSYLYLTLLLTSEEKIQTDRPQQIYL
ncbi:uncharacterized protein RSE6_03705 [Rhynchosporium secalis]|uniref:Uncharacterized protein n=1 Tax=Rhynchosporium secalis TaxID=38038 RepID=A0A1E1M3H2_RHYSE|nr:uncharacterized protein RSE6_03705 [Rhynchosporium secalis]